MIWNEIVCLGDSITFGARDEFGRCYPAELGKLLTKELNEFYYCHNFGINGETSSDLQKRAWNNISSKSNSNIMLLVIGTNDTQIGVTPDIYEDNIRQIVSIAKVFNMRVILGTVPPLKFTPLYLNNTSNIKKYNEKLYKLSEKMGFSVCDLEGIEDYYVDGVHLSHDGNIELAKRFMYSILALQC